MKEQIQKILDMCEKDEDMVRGILDLFSEKLRDCIIWHN